MPTPEIKINSQIELWAIENILPYPLNNKKHPPEQIAKLAASILEFGWDVPIVVDESGVIIKGHGRRLAALQLKLAAVPVVVRRDLSEAQKKACRIADNKLAESEWDIESLKVEFEAIAELNYDLNFTGFDELEIGDLYLGDADHTEAGEEAEETELQESEVIGEGEDYGDGDEIGLSESDSPPLFEAELIVNAAFEHFRKAGFPYRWLPLHACMQELNRLAALPLEKLPRSNYGYHVADTYHPHRFHAPADGMKSPLEGFESDTLLRKAIALELEQGRPVTDKHFAALNYVSGVQVLSNFRPGFALYMYRRFAKPDSVILDTSTGYGGRLVGFMASGCARYIGIDPNVPTYQANQRMASDLGFSDRVELINLPAEDVDHALVAGRCDFAFTSPPYFCKEHYSDDPTQSWQRYKTGEGWRDGFLYPLMKLQFAALKSGGVTGVNIADVKIKGKLYPLGQWTIEAGLAAGFEYVKEERFELSRPPGKAGDSNLKDERENYEPVFMFKKP